MAVRKRIRINSEGAEYFRWEFDYKDELGYRKVKGGFRTKAEAEIDEAKIKTKVNEGTYVSEDRAMTFASAVDNFLNLHASIHCKPSTLYSYQSCIEKHLIPFFGHMKLVEINADRINRFILEKLKEEGLSHKTINNMLTLMGSVIQKAVDNDILAKNPVYKVKRLKTYNVEMRFLDTEEVYAVLDAARIHYPDFYPLLMTAILTGMRRGELLGLTWDKINWKMKKIIVNQSLYQKQIVTPKTQNSVRRIDMADELSKVLRKWKLQCPIGEKNLVFPNSLGDYTDPDNMIKRRYEPVLRKAGLEKIRFHDLRHTYASILIAQNVPIKYIQNQMGHSSIQVTMDRYDHLMPEVYQQGIEALNSLFDPADVQLNLDKAQKTS